MSDPAIEAAQRACSAYDVDHPRTSLTAPTRHWKASRRDRGSTAPHLAQTAMRHTPSIWRARSSRSPLLSWLPQGLRRRCPVSDAQKLMAELIGSHRYDMSDVRTDLPRLLPDPRGGMLMSWHRDTRGLWCPCFLCYQPDDGTGYPAYPCPENTTLTADLEASNDGHLPLV